MDTCGNAKVNSIQAVVFDCDGVLFDTEAANRVYYSRILQHFGQPAVTDEQFAFIHMHTVAESIDYLFPDADIRAEAHEFRKGMDYGSYLQYLVIEPHLIALLEKLRPRIKTAIATNRTDTMTRVLAEHSLEGCFDLVVTASDVRLPKPAPEQLQVILDHFGILPNQMIYIGDSDLDARAAQAAQVPFIAYRNADLTAHRHIEGLHEIVQILGL